MISFDIQLNRPEFSLSAKGEFDDGITAVFGPSGAGKSSLLNCLAGSIKPSDGSVTLGGTTLYSGSRGVWVSPEKRRIGTVYQDGALFPHLSVRKNIEFGWKLLQEDQRRLDPVEIADLLGLTYLLHRPPNELSGGEQQRVAIARALANQPDIILADEPTGNLDQKNSTIVIDLLCRMAREKDQTILVVTHNHAIAEACDQTLPMLDGVFASACEPA